MLSAKPDFEEARTAWEHFWAGEVYKRPLVIASCRQSSTQPQPPSKPRSERPRTSGYHMAFTGRHQEILDGIDHQLETRCWLGEAMPAFGAGFAPDQYAAFLGASIKFSESSIETSWVDPIVEDWESFLPLRFDPSNATFQSLLELIRKLAEHGRGRYLVSCIDAHSHGDTLSALRGPERFCLDFLDHPDLVARAMADARKMFPAVYSAVYDAGNMGTPAGCAQQALWCEGKCGVIQCDFITMISREHFRRFILPAIEEEAAFLDHCMFHLDGVGAFRHLDDLLAVKDIDVIQVLPGDGRPPTHMWVDHLKRVLKAGKAVQILGAGLDLDRIKVLHRELGPERVMYLPSVHTREGIEEVLNWLEQNT